VQSGVALDPCQPSGGGLKCVGRERTAPHPTLTADAEGVARWVVDFSAPQFANIQPGSERYFQMLYDDPGGAGGFNWSEPLRITFCP
jgi:hypothetical protein